MSLSNLKHKPARRAAPAKPAEPAPKLPKGVEIIRGCVWSVGAHGWTVRLCDDPERRILGVHDPQLAGRIVQAHKDELVLVCTVENDKITKAEVELE
jgi:hypothetical protein